MALKKKSTIMVIVLVEVEGKGWAGKPGQCQGLSDLRGRSIENKVMVLYPVLTHHLGPWGSVRKMVIFLLIKIFVTLVVIGSVQWLEVLRCDSWLYCFLYQPHKNRSEKLRQSDQTSQFFFFFSITEVNKTDSFGQSMHARGLTFQGRECSENNE